MLAITNSTTPLQAFTDCFRSGKLQPPVKPRPMSQATDFQDTDFEDDSDADGHSAKGSFESVSVTTADDRCSLES